MDSNYLPLKWDWSYPIPWPSEYDGNDTQSVSEYRPEILLLLILLLRTHSPGPLSHLHVRTPISLISLKLSFWTDHLQMLWGRVPVEPDLSTNPWQGLWHERENEVSLDFPDHAACWILKNLTNITGIEEWFSLFFFASMAYGCSQTRHCGQVLLDFWPTKLWNIIQGLPCEVLGLVCYTIRDIRIT